MQPSPNGSNGRDNNGRFAKGNPGGPGNPNAKNANKWRQILAELVTEEDFEQIVQRMVQDAINGDKDARNQILDRLCGKPCLVREPEVDEDEFRVIKFFPMHGLTHTVTPDGATPIENNNSK